MINLATEDPKELLKNASEVGKGVISGELQDGILTQEGGAILPNDEYLKPAERFKKSSQWLRMLGF